MTEINEEIKRNVYIINTAVNRLECKVKPPKNDMERTHFLSAIGDIKTAVRNLISLITDDDP